MKWYFFFAFLSLWLIACTENNSISSNNSLQSTEKIIPESDDTLVLNDTLSIAFGDTVGSDAENIWITFDSLGADSRCPENVTCIWEGNGEVFFRLFNDEFNLPFELNTHPDHGQEVTLNGYHFHMTALWPIPNTDSTYTKDDYSAQLIVSKL